MRLPSGTRMARVACGKISRVPSAMRWPAPSRASATMPLSRPRIRGLSETRGIR